MRALNVTYACVSGELGQMRDNVNSVILPHLQAWANRDEAGGDTSLGTHSMKSYTAMWAGQKQWR